MTSSTPGDVINLHCLHPRPPEPLRNQDATPRDAELVLVGRAIGDNPADPPTIVTGDLNDVAWSHTTRLFLRQEERGAGSGSGCAE